MKELGVYAYVRSFGETLYSEKFLLSSEEEKDLTRVLRQTPMDVKFEGEDIPKEILPENLLRSSISDLGVDVSSVEHPEINRWKVNYLFNFTGEHDKRELILYPELSFMLESSEEGNVLTVDPDISFYLKLKDREKEHDYVDDNKWDVIKLVNEYSKRNGNEFIVTHSAPIYDGWNFVPVSSMKDVCSTIDKVTKDLSVNDLELLAALGHIKEYMRTPHYGEEDRRVNSFLEGAMKGKYSEIQSSIVNKIMSSKS